MIKIENRKPRILFLGDDVRLFSGVGTCMDRISRGFVEDGWEVFNLGAAINPPNTDLVIDEIGRKIKPSNGYGDWWALTNLMKEFKPDIIFAMTDPRYWIFLFSMEEFYHKYCPLIYYHVWDNYPIPRYNFNYYNSCDSITCISKLSYDIVDTCAKETKSKYHYQYVPHGVNVDLFRPIDLNEKFDNVLDVGQWEANGKKGDRPGQIDLKYFKKRVADSTKQWGQDPEGEKFLVFWTNKNMRRKRPSSLMEAFAAFAKGKDDVVMILHTEPATEYGTDLPIVKDTLFKDAPIVILPHRIPEDELIRFYNIANCVPNIASAEGFGLSSLEAMACGVPLINGMLGGLQDQIYLDNDPNKPCGIAIPVAASDLVGSLPTPYIKDDFVAVEDVANAFQEVYEAWKNKDPKYDTWKANARENAVKNFNNVDMVGAHVKEARRLLKEWNKPPRYVMEIV